MIILCILIFPFAIFAELMKMNNGGGKRRWEGSFTGPGERKESRRNVVDSAVWLV